VAELRVPADHSQLVLVQWPGLHQHGVRDAELADVVQHRGDPDHLRGPLGQAAGLRQQAGVQPDPLDVPAGLLVPQRQRRGQPVGGLAVVQRAARGAALELPKCGLRRPRAVDELALHLRLVGAAATLEVAQPQRVGHVDEQLVAAERLDDVRRGAEPEHLGREVGVVDAGEHHDGHVLQLLGGGPDQLDTGAVGQPNVADHDVDVVLQQPAAGLGHGRGGEHGVARLGEDLHDGGAHQWLVVHDEHGRATPPGAGNRPTPCAPAVGVTATQSVATLTRRRQPTVRRSRNGVLADVPAQTVQPLTASGIRGPSPT
jgi:hypothetical protein